MRVEAESSSGLKSHEPEGRRVGRVLLVREERPRQQQHADLGGEVEVRAAVHLEDRGEVGAIREHRAPRGDVACLARHERVVVGVALCAFEEEGVQRPEGDDVAQLCAQCAAEAELEPLLGEERQQHQEAELQQEEEG
eukprot:scaffold40527_cov57-Phaeocystis_antarctica.AAC.1